MFEGETMNLKEFAEKLNEFVKEHPEHCDSVFSIKIDGRFFEKVQDLHVDVSTFFSSKKHSLENKAVDLNIIVKNESKYDSKTLGQSPDPGYYGSPGDAPHFSS